MVRADRGGADKLAVIYMDKRAWLMKLLEYIREPLNRIDEMRFNKTCSVYLYNYSVAQGEAPDERQALIQLIDEINNDDPDEVLKRVQMSLSKVK